MRTELKFFPCDRELTRETISIYQLAMDIRSLFAQEQTLRKN